MGSAWEKRVWFTGRLCVVADFVGGVFVCVVALWLLRSGDDDDG